MTVSLRVPATGGPGLRGRPSFFVFGVWLALLAPVVSALDVAQPEAATGFESRAEVAGRSSMAVTANPHASAAALEILDLGGNAIDATIAAQLVLNVVEPQSSGIGGGGFLLYWDARERRASAYDGRETAPAAIKPDFALTTNGQALRFDEVVATGKSVGTPGLLAMLELSHQRHGRLRWERLFRPAIRLALDGFSVSPRLHSLLAEDRFLRQDPQARAVFYPDGQALPVGAWLRQPALAATLSDVARAGATVLYQGDIAREFVRIVQQRGGSLSESDLTAYRPRVRDPVCVRLIEFRVCGMPPPSSGGVAVAQILALLQHVGAAEFAPDTAAFAHLFAEAGRLAFADRGRYLADPEFVTVPVESLLGASYLAERSRMIDPLRSMGTAVPGIPVAGLKLADGAPSELPATTHLSVVDGDGNGVALTSSIESGFGSRIMVRGFLLNNQLTDFSFIPERDGNPVANRAEPGKRPMSSMAPTLVLRDQRHASGRRPRVQLEAILGSPGGPRIINYTARALWSLLIGAWSPSRVVALPHVGNRNGATELEAATAAVQLAEPLRQKGHEISIVPMTSGLHLLRRSDSGWVGAADPRREGLAVGR